MVVRHHPRPIDQHPFDEAGNLRHLHHQKVHPAIEIPERPHNQRRPFPTADALFHVAQHRRAHTRAINQRERPHSLRVSDRIVARDLAAHRVSRQMKPRQPQHLRQPFQTPDLLLHPIGRTVHERALAETGQIRRDHVKGGCQIPGTSGPVVLVRTESVQQDHRFASSTLQIRDRVVVHLHPPKHQPRRSTLGPLVVLHQPPGNRTMENRRGSDHPEQQRRPVPPRNPSSDAVAAHRFRRRLRRRTR